MGALLFCGGVERRAPGCDFTGAWPSFAPPTYAVVAAALAAPVVCSGAHHQRQGGGGLCAGPPGRRGQVHALRPQARTAVRRPALLADMRSLLSGQPPHCGCCRRAARAACAGGRTRSCGGCPGASGTSGASSRRAFTARSGAAGGPAGSDVVCTRYGSANKDTPAHRIPSATPLQEQAPGPTTRLSCARARPPVPLAHTPPCARWSDPLALQSLINSTRRPPHTLSISRALSCTQEAK